jgi:hypothetical protein
MDTTGTQLGCLTLHDRLTGDELDGWGDVVSWSLPGGSWLQINMHDGSTDLVQVDPGHLVRFTPDPG